MHSVEENKRFQVLYPWQLWCRLCAKEDASTNIEVNPKHETISDMSKCDYNLTTVVRKFFRICLDDQLPKLLCRNCNSLLIALSTFSEHVSKVQQMYTSLLKEGNIVDISEVRDNYDVNNDEWEHIFPFQRFASSDNSFKSKETIFLESQNFQSDETLSEKNPFENLNSSLNIKEEIEMIPEDVLDVNLNESTPFAINDEDDSFFDDEMETEEDVLAVDKALYIQESEKKKHSTDTIKNTISCPDCDKCFTRKNTLRIHRETKHGLEKNGYVCPTCNKRFYRKYSYDRHVTIHLPKSLKEDVACSFCDKKFSSYAISHHIKYTHMNTGFICEECGVSAKTHQALKEHMLTHTDYAPFECKVCKKCFKNQHRLKRHAEIHDPNKHICAECGLQLNSRATLNRHLLVHSDVMKHKCDYCGRSFKRAKALKNHLILHTGLKPYSCDFCSRTFANGSNCRTHKKKAHPEELAALEASGSGKMYTKNIPKLEALKAVTKTTGNLTPVVSKQSGNFACGKKIKNTLKCTSDSEKFN